VTAAHPYCPHDEGEPCDCAALLDTAERPPATNRPRPADAKRATVHQLAAQGLTSREIAAQIGCTQRSVERYRRSHTATRRTT
jgi:DNA-binding NarL/FixJ family response regulator